MTYYKRNNNDKLLGEVIALIFIAFILFLILPFLTYWAGYLDGWITMKTVGPHVVKAINCTFGTEFAIKDLPKIGGALGWLGGMFLPHNYIKTKKGE